jgi:hypothetical protein
MLASELALLAAELADRRVRPDEPAGAVAMLKRIIVAWMAAPSLCHSCSARCRSCRQSSPMRRAACSTAPVGASS